MKLIFYRTKSLLRSERFAWFLQSANGEKLARSEGYTTKMDCTENAAMVTNYRSRHDIQTELRW